MGNNGFNNGMANKRKSTNGYSLLYNSWNRGVLNDKKVLRGMLNAFGIMTIAVFCYNAVYNWIVLDIAPTDTKELVIWILGGIYLIIKLYGIAVRMKYHDKNQKQEQERKRLDNELTQIEIEERRSGLAKWKARQDDYDENNITG